MLLSMLKIYFFFFLVDSGIMDLHLFISCPFLHLCSWPMLLLTNKLAQVTVFQPVGFTWYELGLCHRSHYVLIWSSVPLYGHWFSHSVSPSLPPFCPLYIPLSLSLSLYISPSLLLSFALSLCMWLYMFSSLITVHAILTAQGPQHPSDVSPRL